MNEVLGPIYYVCAKDLASSDFGRRTCEFWWAVLTLFVAGAESDSFHCFKNLMGEIRDNFCKTLDHSELGVTGSLQKFSGLLQETDFEVWQHLV